MTSRWGWASDVVMSKLIEEFFVFTGTFAPIELSELMESSCETHSQYVSARMHCHQSEVNPPKGNKIPVYNNNV